MIQTPQCRNSLCFPLAYFLNKLRDGQHFFRSLHKLFPIYCLSKPSKTFTILSALCELTEFSGKGSLRAKNSRVWDFNIWRKGWSIECWTWWLWIWCHFSIVVLSSSPLRPADLERTFAGLPSHPRHWSQLAALSSGLSVLLNMTRLPTQDIAFIYISFPNWRCFWALFCAWFMFQLESQKISGRNIQHLQHTAEMGAWLRKDKKQ